MAYMSQQKKAEIAAELKKVIPRDWKYTLGVRHHSSIVLNIWAAPIDILGERSKIVAESWRQRGDVYKPETHAQINEYHLEGQFKGELLAIFEKIKRALNLGNHDNSDPQTDYFDVGWYVDINLGKWDKPFQVIAAAKELTREELKARIASIEASQAKNDVGRARGDSSYQAQSSEAQQLKARLNVPKSDLAHCWRMQGGTC